MYCTVDDLRASMPDIRLVEATDDAHPNEMGVFQAAIAEEQIELACGIIDGYLAARFVLPLAVVPVIVRKVAVDLTLYGLYERIGMTGQNSPMETRRANAMKILMAISAGSITLGLSAGDAASVPAASSRAAVSSSEARFTLSSMSSLGGTP